jgi:ABC-type transport system involved in multi-copper enzyme maturation permease subunit
MIASLRAELLRLRKWPVTWVITGVWLTLNVMFGYVFDYLSYRDAVGGGDQRLADALLSQLSLAEVPSTMVTGLPMFGSALLLILAALATGSGYGWNTWRTVFTQGPGRLSALGGTMLALAVVLVIFTVLTLLTDLLASSIVTTAAGQALTWPGLGALAEGLGGALLIGATWAAAGALIGILARSPALSVGLGLVWVLIVENLLRGVASLLGPLEAVTDVLPGSAAGSLAGALGAAAAPEPGGAPGVLTVLTGAESIGLLAIYLVAFLVSAGLVMSRRDA